jgi:hypothetical protein
MALPWYQYAPLTSETSFRLFRLRSQSTSDVSPIAFEIELFEASHEKPPPFEAVSYAWGSGGLDCTILCNGQALPVSETIIEFFEALGGTDSIGTLWIDAICINQASVAEKNVQVPKMRTIYSEAETVWVWLGNGSYETDIVFDHLSEVERVLDPWFNGERKYDYEEMDESMHKPRRSYKGQSVAFLIGNILTVADKVVKSRGVYDAVDTDFIIDLLNLPWFSRTWTVQELVLARNAFVLCGTKCLQWKGFAHTVAWVQLYEDSLAYWGDHENTSNPAAFISYLECYGILREQGGEGLISIDTALELVRSKNATDPRDKVYGVYGLLSEKELPLVDYHRSVQDVFTDITIVGFQRKQSLRILRQVCLPRLIQELPSWVPDYSNTSFYLQFDSFCAPSRRSKYQLDGYKLSVSGLFVDRICDIAPSTSVSTSNFRRGWNARVGLDSSVERHAAVIELVRTIQAWIKVVTAGGDGQKTQYSRSAFFHTLLRIVSAQHNGLPPMKETLQTWIHILTADPSELQLLHQEIQTRASYNPIVQDYMRLFGCSPNLEEWVEELIRRLVIRVYSVDVSRLQHDISLITYQRALFTAHGGHIGVGPRWIQPNDSIVVFAGESVPFIVRGTGEHWSLIGPAYIYGMMNEEEWDDAKVQMITLA